VLTALALQLPSWLFGWRFAAAGLVLVDLPHQVPYYPSGPAVWDAVRQLCRPIRRRA
jgi:hypothetical protein